MILYAAHAVPWLKVGVAAALIVALMELVGRWPWQTWPLQGTAVGLLAGAAAWCFDEPAAAVVDPTPRSLIWRTAARSSGVLVLASAWAVSVSRAWDGLFGHPWVVTVQGAAAMAAGAAWATWRRASAIASPGTPLAISVVPLLTGWALTRPFDERLPVFPYGPQGSGDWGASLAGWTCLGVAAVAILLAALADAPWWTLRCRDAGRLGEVNLDPLPRAGTGSPRGSRSRPVINRIRWSWCRPRRSRNPTRTTIRHDRRLPRGGAARRTGRTPRP